MTAREIIAYARASRLCDACGFLIEAESRRRAPSEASAVEVLRELVAWDTGRAVPCLHTIVTHARRVLAEAGPDPMPVVRAAMAWRLACGQYGGRPIDLELKTLEAVDAYRKAGGTP